MDPSRVRKLTPSRPAGPSMPRISRMVGATSRVRISAWALSPAGNRGPAHEERNGERRLIEEETVGVLLVLAQGLSMIRGHDDDGRVEKALCLEKANEPTQQGIHVENLAEVARERIPERRARTLRADRKVDGGRKNEGKQKRAGPGSHRSTGWPPPARLRPDAREDPAARSAASGRNTRRNLERGRTSRRARTSRRTLRFDSPSL